VFNEFGQYFEFKNRYSKNEKTSLNTFNAMIVLLYFSFSFGDVHGLYMFTFLK
jgi:hypothetical protein